MSKSQCQLNHSRNLSTSWKSANYQYDRERSKATAKQIKFYTSLYYKFKENNLDINKELDERGIDHSVIQHPSGRCGYSEAIDTMINILSEKGLYKPKDTRSNFINTYNAQSDSGGAIKRTWQKIEREVENE